ncbi:9270_t:CDS:2 [Funneliformis geosporum]|uniref:9270_t:CDS:1 n=1 Tax=Funneliformis geosporum TaxID=1117311 RepID=A0A9W4STA3_9GLOM|nr:9270_t:CDS:2 [Funneliformis geosporum]
MEGHKKVRIDMLLKVRIYEKKGVWEKVIGKGEESKEALAS